MKSASKVCTSLFLAIMCARAASGLTLNVTSTNDSGPGTFRQALLDVNASPGPHLVQFHLPGTGVGTLAPLTALAEITNSVHHYVKIGL